MGRTMRNLTQWMATDRTRRRIGPSAQTAQAVAPGAPTQPVGLLDFPVSRMLLGCSCLPALAETGYALANGNDSTGGLLITLTVVGASMLMAFTPRFGAWTLMILWAALQIGLPSMTPFSSLFAVMMAAMALSYLRTRQALAAGLVAAISTTISLMMRPGDGQQMVILCVTVALLLIALWFGMSLRWREEREREQLERARLLRRLGNTRVAEELHHSVANDLTGILLLTQQLHHDARQTAETSQQTAQDDRTIDLLEQTAQTSLAKVRHIIASLDEDGSDVVQEPAQPLTASITLNEISTLMAAQDRRLHAAGMDGMGMSNGERACAISPERKAMLLDMIHEMYGNALKHADSHGGYCIAVTLGAQMVTIAASNACRKGISEDNLAHGTGLRRCREAAERCGGEFRNGIEDGGFSCLIKLPLA